MKKTGMRILTCLGLCVLSITLANALHRAFINDDGDLIHVSPYVTENLDILENNKPHKLYLQVSTNQKTLTDRFLLTENTDEIEQLVSDIQWTWVTNLKEIPDDDTVYELSFSDINGELIYPLLYYPQSDTLVFVGRQNKVSMQSSDKLKKMLAEHLDTK
ncbi:hypothetical protein [Brevibacillus sp. NRS-1366]|uniref:hypothetical protein n=1 Tax=Brevibacillus sp. NRS-1366 TaxID=3233899 RepID=UPI003D203740